MTRINNLDHLGVPAQPLLTQANTAVVYDDRPKFDNTTSIQYIQSDNRPKFETHLLPQIRMNYTALINIYLRYLTGH
jgi:hypothetical protein